MPWSNFTRSKKNAEAVEKTIKDLIESQPAVLANRVQLASLYIQLSRWEEAEKTLRAAIKDFPQDPAPSVLLAEFFIRRGDIPKAEAELKAAIAANPAEVKLRLALAQVQEQTKHPDQAEKTLRDYSSETDNKPGALKAKDALAGLLVRLGRVEEAKSLLKDVLAESPQDNEALLMQGKLALAQKNIQEAITSFRSILKDQPESTEVLSLLASAYFQDGKTNLAQENLEKAVSLKPDDFSLRKNLVEFLVQQKNLPLALEKADEFLKQKPNGLDGLNLKADVLALSQQPGPLEDVLKEIKKGYPDNALGPMRLGGLYADQKKIRGGAR